MADGDRVRYAEHMDRLPRPLWWLVIGVALNSLGFAFLWPLTAIYLHEVLGQPMTIVGSILMIQSGAGLAGSLWGGTLFDRFGGRRPLLGGAALASLLFLLLLVNHTVLVYALATSGASFAIGVVFPCLNALAGQLWPEGGRKAFNAVYVAQNVGVALGSILGGLVATLGFQWTFLAGATLVGGFFVIVLRVYRGPGWERPRASAHTPAKPTPRVALSFAGWMLAAAFALDWLAYVQWQSTTPNFMHHEGFPLPLYSLLWTINGGLVLLGQPLIQWVVRRLPSVKVQILGGNLLFISAYLLLATIRLYPAYMAGMALATLGEMLVWPGVPAAADRLAPPGRRGLYQGVIVGAGAMGRMLGPLVGGLLYLPTAPARLFLAMVGIYATAVAVYVLYDHKSAWTRPQTPSLDQ